MKRTKSGMESSMTIVMNQQHRKEDAEHFLGKAFGTLDAVGLDLLRKQRHEGRIERPFRKTDGGTG